MGTSRTRSAIVFSLLMSVFVFSGCASLGLRSLGSGPAGDSGTEAMNISACLVNQSMESPHIVYIDYSGSILAEIGTAHTGETFVSSDEFPSVAKAGRRVVFYAAEETEDRFSARHSSNRVDALSLSDGVVVVVEMSGPSAYLMSRNQVSKHSPCYEDIQEES